MKTLNLVQGTDKWLEARKKYFTASNSPAMMGDGYDSRDKAMRYALGLEVKEVSAHLQAIFDAGHNTEALARPVAEKLFSEVFSPIVGVRTVEGLDLMASFDGINFDGDLIWEHKNTSKEFEDIPPLYYWQLEHQMLVADCDKAVLTITSKKDDGIYHRHYKSVPQRRKALIKGWKQWKKDLESYERVDKEWLDAAVKYKWLKAQVETLSLELKEAGTALHLLAGNNSASGGGVKVSVSKQFEKKMTAAQWIKENEIKLPAEELEEPKINYRITLEK